MANKTYLGVPTQHTVKQCPDCKSSDTNFLILKEGTTVEPTIWELSCNNCGYVKSTTDESEFNAVVTDDLSNNVKKMYIGSTDSYKILDYIESSGTQYIDTGYKPTNNSRVVMEVEALKSGVYPFFGARTANGVDSFVLWEMSSNSIRSDFNTTGTETTVSTVLTRIIIDKNKNVCKFGDKTITNGAASFNCPHNLCLLALNSGEEIDERKLSAKLYHCQIYDNDRLIRDFKPCKNSNGILGLYDSINNKFYKNSGTGNFISGTETGETIEPPSSNSHKILKGYIGDSINQAKLFFSSGFTWKKYNVEYNGIQETKKNVFNINGGVYYYGSGMLNNSFHVVLSGDSSLYYNYNQYQINKNTGKLYISNDASNSRVYSDSSVPNNALWTGYQSVEERDELGEDNGYRVCLMFPTAAVKDIQYDSLSYFTHTYRREPYITTLPKRDKVWFTVTEHKISAKPTKGTYIEDVESSNPSAYPDNGIGTDGYWYVKQL